jgi:hypothetical protein
MPRFRKPSPAFALAFLALLVALSSSAGANPVAFVSKAVSGTSIKKHSIPVTALSPATVKKLHGAKGSRGPRGLTGAKGAMGASGATNVSVVNASCGPAPCNHVIATCPAGARATGGGGLATGNQLLYESRPIPQSGTPTAWEVAGGAATPPIQGAVIAYAVCASP